MPGTSWKHAVTLSARFSVDARRTTSLINIKIMLSEHWCAMEVHSILHVQLIQTIPKLCSKEGEVTQMELVGMPV